jgi:hypothetical protein
MPNEVRTEENILSTKPIDETLGDRLKAMGVDFLECLEMGEDKLENCIEAKISQLKSENLSASELTNKEWDLMHLRLVHFNMRASYYNNSDTLQKDTIEQLKKKLEKAHDFDEINLILGQISIEEKKLQSIGAKEDPITLKQMYDVQKQVMKLSRDTPQYQNTAEKCTISLHEKGQFAALTPEETNAAIKHALDKMAKNKTWCRWFAEKLGICSKENPFEPRQEGSTTITRTI